MKNNKYNVIGIMSGTSCDGLDIAHSLFWFENNKWIYKLKKYKSVSYSKKLKSRLLKCSKLDALSLKILDLDFGEYIKGEIKKFIKESNTRFDLISCHGHTVFHDAKNKINFQIGNPFIIYKSFQIPIVFNFRELDVIMGGQGAPLVPYGDKHLFYDYDYCINIGGILNISSLNTKRLFGYDICPANIILNYFSRKLNMDFDLNGTISSSGNLDKNLFDKLNNLKYYNQKPPKSLDLRYIENNYLNLFKDKDPKNILYTYINHIAYQLNNNLIKRNSKVLLTGGGVFNKHLIEKIESFNKLDHNFIVPNKKIIIFKEAIVFGFLGLLRFLNKKNIDESVTGSEFSTSSGIIIENKIL